MLTNDDRASMRSTKLSIISDNQKSIIIRRAGASLPAQDVRIVRTGGQGSVVSSEGTQASKTTVLVVGGTTLDIQQGDRFTDDDVLYEVSFIRPNKTIGVTAEATAVE